MFKHGRYNFREEEVLKYIPIRDVARVVREHALWRIFLQYSAFPVHSGVCFVAMMIMAYSFEITLSENANFTTNNVNNCVFTIDGVWNYAFSSKVWRMFMYFCILV